MKVMRSVIIDAPIEKVWAAVRAFDGVVHWNPGVTAARMETGAATAVGSIRHLDIADGTIFRETLLAHSDQEYFYTYDIVEGPLPCTDYISTHRFIPITDGNLTLGIWSGEFTCDPADAEALEEIVGDQIYRDGMRGLNAYLATL
ncbi:MAG: SRPBCC family protein [Candidatus Puniceispirillales bacterium]